MGSTSLFVFTCICFGLLINVATSYGQSQHDNKTYKVTTILGRPYVMFKQSFNETTTTPPLNNALEGLLIDILNEIAKDRFNYSIQMVADGFYGSPHPVKGWNGMVGELIDGTADLVVAPLTITAMRAKDITFSHPVMDAGLRILYKKPTIWKQIENVFVLLTPFSAGVWIVLLIVFVIASILLYVVVRFSPLDRDAKTNRPPDAFSIDKCFLYTFRALTWQGMGVVPKSFSGRVFSATWWSVCLIVIACYIANLTGFFLTKEPGIRLSPFLTFEDLSRQTHIRYGCVANGSTYHYFKNSQLNMEKRMWNFMSSVRPSVFVKSADEGIQMVQNSNGRYAFIAEETYAEYHAGRSCDLIVLGEPITDHAYGFACSQRAAALCRDIDVMVLKLKETDRIRLLKKKWFHGPCSASQMEEFLFEGNLFFGADEKGNIKMEKAVTLKRMLSVWVIFLIGSVLSFIVLAVELLFRGRKGKGAARLDVPEDQETIQEYFDDQT